MGLIYLNSCLVIYLVERHPVWFEAVRRNVSAEPDARFAISPLVKAECLIGPMRRGDFPLEGLYRAFFETLITLDMNESIFMDAARLRARFGLKMPDAMHLACAQRHACAGLWTNDGRLATAGGALVRAIAT